MGTQRGIALVSVRSVRPVLGHVEHLGIPLADVLAGAGLERQVFDDDEARVPHEAALAVWREAVDRSGDAFFGLHTAERIRPGAFDVLDYAIRASATLGDGLVRLTRHHRALHDVARIDLEHDGSVVRLTHVLPPAAPVLPRHPAEFIVAGWLVVARQATGRDLTPEEVTFRHAAPADVSEHRRLFRARVRFGSASNGIVLRRDLLDVPLVKADSGLCAVLERHVSDLVAKMPAPSTLNERVRQMVASELASGVPTGAVLAKRLHMSRRTLQRQLADEGTTLREIIDALRRELALRYVGDRELALCEIAFLLGFSDQSSFHRAFVRWYERTPARYRQDRRARVPDN